MKLLLYCTKAKPILMKQNNNRCYLKEELEFINMTDLELNGKIVAECDFEVEEIIFEGYGVGLGYRGTKSSVDKLSKGSCLYSYNDIDNYLKGKNGYAIHINNLHIFDEPRELNNYYKFIGIYDNINTYKNIEKAPQNMMKVMDEYGNKYILISIIPEWLCKILNGEKTIEVRRKVLKDLEEKEKQDKELADIYEELFLK